MDETSALRMAILVLHLTGLACAIVAVMQTRSPQGAIAWAVSLITFPYLAVPLYLVFGRTKFQGYLAAREHVAERVVAASTSLGAALERFVVRPTEHVPAHAAFTRIASNERRNVSMRLAGTSGGAA